MDRRSRGGMGSFGWGRLGTATIGLALFAGACASYAPEEGAAPALETPSPMAQEEATAAVDTAVAPADPASAERARPTGRPAPRPMANRGPDNQPVSGSAPTREPVEPNDEPEPDAPRPPTATYDWGGSTYLSNDDSMSLASAQRLLWSLKHGAQVAASQIRKHELLNYFTFDDVEPAHGQLFAVHTSAVEEGDTLHLAMNVKGAVPAAQPLDLTLLVDRSGSMKEENRMGYTKKGLRLLVEQLNDGDTVDLLAFNSGAELVVEDFVVGRDRIVDLQRAIDGIQPGGSTDLDAGLQAAYDVARGNVDPDRNRRVMLITDARTNTGQVDPHQLSEVGRHLDEAGIRLTGVGVGSDFNDALLDRLTEKGKGAYVYVGSEAVVERMFRDSVPALTQTIAHDVHFQLHLPERLALKRFHGEAASTKKADIQPVHFFAGNTQVFSSELAIHERGLRDGDRLILDITWRDPVTNESKVQSHHVSVGEALDSSPANVTKARALMAWSDVLLARALHTSPDEASSRFLALAEQLNDPEISYARSLLGPLAASRSLTVTVPSSSPHTEAERVCAGGLRQRAPRKGGQFHFPELAGARDCTVRFKGGAPVPRVPVGESEELMCVFDGGRAVCNG